MKIFNLIIFLLLITTISCNKEKQEKETINKPILNLELSSIQNEINKSIDSTKVYNKTLLGIQLGIDYPTLKSKLDSLSRAKKIKKISNLEYSYLLKLKRLNLDTKINFSMSNKKLEEIIISNKGNNDPSEVKKEIVVFLREIFGRENAHVNLGFASREIQYHWIKSDWNLSYLYFDISNPGTHRIVFNKPSYNFIEENKIKFAKEAMEKSLKNNTSKSKADFNK